MGSKGFSMIEMLIALVILAISLLALAGLMATTTRNNSFGGHMTEAATFAQDKLEELKALPWANIAGGADTKPGSTGITYARTWNVSTLLNPTPPPNDLLKAVTITVNWNDGVSRSINIFSAIRNSDDL
jgi:prepilin-type N-terminal cleavage/methylation domain-containing protein